MKRTLVCALSCVALLLASAIEASADERATVTGYLADAQGLKVAQARIQITNVDTNLSYVGESNEDGLFRISSIPTGIYRIIVQKTGFKTIVKQGVELHVQDVVALNFQLEVGSIAESVTVEGGAPLINTQDAAVSTVVDRQFAENLPMNGRSFQSLIQLTPGVVVAPANQLDFGQFSVNGQRAVSNYWMVDGVSANIGMSTLANSSNGLGGTLGSFSVFGGTNSLVSVDALQEFRIQTSTFAPEFGRAPGAQISILTRSGTNQFHGTLFDYLRNDVLDANDWFANSLGLPKPKERQNDFGGTFSGPILKDKTFFFLSYEGLRLRLPQTRLTNVPDLAARQNAVTAMQPFLNAFPLPNGPDSTTTGIAGFNASFSNPGTLDAYSLRIDHKLNDKLGLFGRFNFSPSELDQRGFGSALSIVTPQRITALTGTAGLTWSISPATVNDFRFNYSSTDSSLLSLQDNFGGAVPMTSFPFPAGFSQENAVFAVGIDSLGFASGNTVSAGSGNRNSQRQINVVDGLSTQKGSHSLKFGVDFRRLWPETKISEYLQTGIFSTVPQAETGNTELVILASRGGTTLLFRNLGVFAQDAWRISRRMTLTYGLRWDTDFAPSTLSGPRLPAAIGFNLKDLSQLALAPAGTPPFSTRYGNVAPRLGAAYQLTESQDWQTVLRGGFGVFYDLATAETGNILVLSQYPFGATNFLFGAAFPLTSGANAPPPVTPPAPGAGQLFAFDPKLQLPYTLQWNLALEQGLGSRQNVTATYIGAAGRRLQQTTFVLFPNANFFGAELVTDSAVSNYNALQLQFQRRLSRGLQALASYTWSHSIDTASAGSLGSLSNALAANNASANRGPSDFDVRNAFSAGVTYDVPAPKINRFTNAILRGWSLQTVVQARSAPPVGVSDAAFFELNGSIVADIRPDLVPGQPLYLRGPQYPGGKAFNPAAFTDPPAAPPGPNCPAGGCPTRQGTTPRNFLRGFGAAQWDFGVHREFPIHESLKLQFRAEMFNVLNHPNFGPPSGVFLSPPNGGPAGFGVATQMLGQSLNGPLGLGGGSFDPLYQIGGPRSIQFGLKLQF